MSGAMYVVLDTCVLIRAIAGLGVNGETLKHIIEKCHTIVYSSEILDKEYKAVASRAGSLHELQRKLGELVERKKTKLFGKSYIMAKSRGLVLKREPKDPSDIKFLVLALVTGARYVVTRDSHLLEISPYQDDSHLELVEPKDYLATCCKSSQSHADISLSQVFTNSLYPYIAKGVAMNKKATDMRSKSHHPHHQGFSSPSSSPLRKKRAKPKFR